MSTSAALVSSAFRSCPSWLWLLVVAMVLAVLQPLLVRFLQRRAPRTELLAAEEYFKHLLAPLRPLGRGGASRIRQMLEGSDFDFLGPWRSNTTLIQEANERLVRGDPVLIDKFLDDRRANALYSELLSSAREGLLHTRRTSDLPFSATGVNTTAWAMDASASSRCGVLAEVGHDFKFRHHACCAGEPSPDRHAAMQTFARSFGQRWAGAMNLLLAGSGYRVLNESAGATTLEAALDRNSFREFFVGDYHLLHTDSLSSRVLTINYWLATPAGWNPNWGGSLLWCGLPRYSHGETVLPSFPDAVRIPPAFNQALIFLPHLESIHAVEPVLPTKAPDAHRFASTFWMTAPGLDEAKHWHTFTARARLAAGLPVSGQYAGP